MTEFLGSISWIGWALIMLAALTIWQMPALIRGAFTGNSGKAERPMQPGENPPHLGPDGH